MSDEPDSPGSPRFEQPGPARDEDLADSLGIEDAAGRHEQAAEHLPTAESPPPPPLRPPRSTGIPDSDLSRLESAHADSEPGTPDVPAEVAPIDPTLSGWAAYRDRRRAAKAVKANRPRRKAPWWELPALVAVAIGIAILVKTFVIQPFYIPSASMEKTLYGNTHGGDRILVNKPIYDLRDPHPGDIVVFNAPPGWNDNEPTSQPPSNPLLKVVRGFGQLVGFVPPDGLVLVKRVIATGGQTVLGENDAVYVCDSGCTLPSGWNLTKAPPSSFHKLTEPYVFIDSQDLAANFWPVTVPKGRLWVMGDHRSDSADSRYHCRPDTEDPTPAQAPGCNAVSATVPVSGVIGKAVIIAWPPSRWRTLGTPATFTHGAEAALAGGLPFAGAALLVIPVARRRRRPRPGRPRGPSRLSRARRLRR